VCVCVCVGVCVCAEATVDLWGRREEQAGVCVCVELWRRQWRGDGGGRGSDFDTLNKERLHLFWVKHKERLHVSSYS
jgi:hypothetical protein